MINGARTKVVLLDGTVTDTWSNEWREECLHRKPLIDQVLRMLGRGNRQRREAFYTSIGITEGPEQEKRVREAVAAVWKAEKERMEAVKK